MTLAFAHIDKNRHAERWHSAQSCCGSAFLNRTAAYRRWQDAQLRVLGRLLLRDLLRQSYGLILSPNQIGTGTYGKPFLRDSKIQFNISHSAELAVCVVQQGAAVGVDLEAVKPIAVEEFRPQMTPTEWARIEQSSDPQWAFYDYWTSKEAVLKLLGDGLQRPLQSFEVAADRTHSVVEGVSYHLRACELVEGHCTYLASELPIRQLEIWPEWKEG